MEKQNERNVKSDLGWRYLLKYHHQIMEEMVVPSTIKSGITPKNRIRNSLHLLPKD